MRWQIIYIPTEEFRIKNAKASGDKTRDLFEIESPNLKENRL